MTNNKTSIERMYDALNGARYVRVFEDHDVAEVWHGGATVNSYSLPDWLPLDCWTSYELTTENIANEIQDHYDEALAADLAETD